MNIPGDSSEKKPAHPVAVRIISQAANNLFAYYRIRDGKLPDYCLRIPDDFDPYAEYPGDLGLIIGFVCDACHEVIESGEVQPLQYYAVENIYESAACMKSVVLAVYSLLKLEEFTEIDKDSGELVQYDPLDQIEDLGEMGDLGSTTPLNRLPQIDWERLQETHDILMRTHVRYLNERFKLLEEFMDARDSDEREQILPHLERCGQEITDIRKDIAHFCQKNKFHNTLLPSEEGMTEFEQAIHWNEHQSEENAVKPFDPSEAEQKLFCFLPKDFQRHELFLFQFRFTKDEDGEDDHVEGDLHSFRENQYERKMLIFYYASIYLLLHRRGTATLSPRLLASTRKHVTQLGREIEDIKRIIMNRTDDPDEEALAREDGKLVTYDIQRVEELAVTAGNILQTIDANTVDIKILKIIERLSGILHDFYASVVSIRTDDDLDNFDKQHRIRTSQEDVLEQLKLLQAELTHFKLDNTALDRADRIIQQAIDHLLQY